MPLAPQPFGGYSIIWMTTQEPPFVMPLTGSQKPPVLVIETVTFRRNVIRRNQAVTQVLCKSPGCLKMWHLRQQ